MNIILRCIDDKWSIAAQDVPDECLNLAMRQWRRGGYKVVSIKVS